MDESVTSECRTVSDANEEEHVEALAQSLDSQSNENSSMSDDWNNSFERNRGSLNSDTLSNLAENKPSEFVGCEPFDIKEKGTNLHSMVVVPDDSSQTKDEFTSASVRHVVEVDKEILCAAADDLPHLNNAEESVCVNHSGDDSENEVFQERYADEDFVGNLTSRKIDSPILSIPSTEEQFFPAAMIEVHSSSGTTLQPHSSNVAKPVNRVSRVDDHVKPTAFKSGVDWWDAVGCTQSAAEDGIVSLNSVIAVLDADFHSLPSTQHRQLYGPSLDRIKCRLRFKICGLFGFKLDDDITMTYVDEDSDGVTLVNDEDLRDALKQDMKFLRIDVHRKVVKEGKSDVKTIGGSTRFGHHKILGEILSQVPRESPMDSFTALVESFAKMTKPKRKAGGVLGVKNDSSEKPVAPFVTAVKNDSKSETILKSLTAESNSKNSQTMDVQNVAKDVGISVPSQKASVDLNAMPADSNPSKPADTSVSQVGASLLAA